MRVARKLRITACFVGALALTWAAFFADSYHSHGVAGESALRLARQVASQAEGMVFAARQNEEKDPLGWAVGFLTQGTEPRVMRVQTWLGPVGGDNAETQNLDMARGVFEYSRVLTPEDGSGVKIQIAVDPVGFLGARTSLENDTRVALLFTLLFGTLMLVFGGRAPIAEVLDIRPQIRHWLKDSKGVLVQLGIHIREMVREAQKLAVAAAASRDGLSVLRDRIHANIRETRDARAVLNEAEHAALIAEVLALNLMIAAEKSGDDSKGLTETAEELHRSIQKIRKLHLKSDSLVAKVEFSLEPMATDADIAFHSYDDVFRAAESMDGHIRKTTENLLGQAKMIQNLNGDLAEDPQPEGQSGLSGEKKTG